jgi:hypothetical protein
MSEPDSTSGTPLTRTLGVKNDSRVLVLAAPADFALDEVPSGAVVHRRAGASSYDVILAFCPDVERLKSRLATAVGKLTTAGALWLAWPKRAGGGETDLDDDVVRELGLGAGLVDVKVAVIDETWAALKLVRRIRDR